MGRIVTLKRDRLDEVLDILRQQYGVNYFGAEKEFFEWMFLDYSADWFKPKSDQDYMPVNAVVGDDEKILALHIFQPFDAITPWQGNVGIFDEEWLNISDVRGLGRKLATHLCEKVDVYLGFGCNDLSTNAFQKMGLTFVEAVPKAVAILDAAKLNRALEESGLPEAILIDELRQCNPDGRYYIIDNAAQLPALLLDEYRQTIDFGVSRSTEWLAWRYDNHPSIKYHYVALDEYGEKGVAVVRKEVVVGTDYFVCRITDIFYRSGYEKELIAAVLSFAKENDCLIADFFTMSLKSVKKLMLFADAAKLRMEKASDVPYMYQPIAYSEHNTGNVAFRAKRATENVIGHETFYMTKSDSCLDILRDPSSAATLKRQ